MVMGIGVVPKYSALNLSSCTSLTFLQIGHLTNLEEGPVDSDLAEMFWKLLSTLPSSQSSLEHILIIFTLDLIGSARHNIEGINAVMMDFGCREIVDRVGGMFSPPAGALKRVTLRFVAYPEHMETLKIVATSLKEELSVNSYGEALQITVETFENPGAATGKRFYPTGSWKEATDSC